MQLVSGFIVYHGEQRNSREGLTAALFHVQNSHQQMQPYPDVPTCMQHFYFGGTTSSQPSRENMRSL